MNEMINKNIGKYLYIVGLMLLFPIIILNSMKMYYVCNILFACVLLLCVLANELYLRNNQYRASELMIFWGMVAVFWVTNLFYRFFKITSNFDIVGTIGAIVIVIIFYQCISRCIERGLKKKKSIQSIRQFIRKNLDVVTICTVFVLLNLDIYDLWIKSDGYIYYNGALSNIGKWSFDFKTLDKLQLAGHMTYGYTLLWHIGLMIFKRVGIRIVNMIMAIITICCLKNILNKVFPKMGYCVRTLLMCVCVFSPLFFGISYEISADYSVFCYFIWFVCAYLNSKKIMSLYLAIGFCFTKELSPIILFGFLVGEFLVYLRSIKSFESIWEFIKNYLKKSSIYLSYAGMIFVVAFFTNSSGWSEIGRESISASKNAVENDSIGKVGDTFCFDMEYIWIKIKQMYGMNFMWLVSLVIIFSLIIILIRKRSFIEKIKVINITPIVCSYTFFVLFNLFFFTYVNYRYIQLNIFFMIIFLGASIEIIIKSDKIKKILLCSILSLFFIESYVVVDPLTYAMFDRVNVGKINVISTKTYAFLNGKFVTKKQSDYVNSQVFFDSMLYNRQQISLERLTEKAFSKINFNDGHAIIMPPIFNGDTSYTFRGLFGREEMDSYYWDEKKHNITDNPVDKKIYFVDYYDFVNYDLYNGCTVYYLDYPYESGFTSKNIINNVTEVLSCEKFEYGGWTMKVLKIRKNI